MDELPSTGLRALLQLSRRGTMSAVAAELGYTPGAVSQQISRLETTVGVPLVLKVGRGVRLTDAGRVLVARADGLLRAQEQALAAARATLTQATGRLAIGVFGTTGAAILAPPVISALAREHPGIEVATVEIGVDDSALAVRRGQVDLALGLDYPHAPAPRDPGVEFVRLRTERFGLAVGAQREPAGAGDAGSSTPLPLAAAADWPWVLTPASTRFGAAVRSACRAAGFEPRVVHEVTDTAASLSLAAAGHGVTPVTPLMVRLARAPGTRVVELEDVVERHVLLVRHQGDRERPTVRAGCEAVRRAVEALDAAPS